MESRDRSDLGYEELYWLERLHRDGVSNVSPHHQRILRLLVDRGFAREQGEGFCLSYRGQALIEELNRIRRQKKVPA